jgi:hypothetical protein
MAPTVSARPDEFGHPAPPRPPPSSGDPPAPRTPAVDHSRPETLLLPTAGPWLKSVEVLDHAVAVAERASASTTGYSTTWARGWWTPS